MLCILIPRECIQGNKYQPTCSSSLHFGAIAGSVEGEMEGFYFQESGQSR